MPASPNRWLHRHAVLTAVATLGLICIGGLVTSHGVGMAVPDWPNTYGYNLFFFPFSKWIGGIFYEHTHRLAGALVGALTLVLALWTQGCRIRPVLRWGGALLLAGGAFAGLGHWARLESVILGVAVGGVALGASWFWPRCEPAPRLLRTLALWALAGVILQGVLGGLRVVLLSDRLGIVHATLAQLFFVLVSILAVLTGWRHREEVPERELIERGRVASLKPWFIATALLVLVQLVLGASMRHRHAGLAIPDFPLAYGRMWPATDADSLSAYNQAREETRAFNAITALDVQLHMTHRLAAVAVVVMLGIVGIQARRRLGGSHVLARGALVWAGLGLVQLGLGALTVWTNKSADIATAHVAVGSLILMLGGVLTVVAFRLSQLPVQSPAPLAAAETPLSMPELAPVRKSCS